MGWEYPIAAYLLLSQEINRENEDNPWDAMLSRASWNLAERMNHMVGSTFVTTWAQMKFQGL